MPKRFNRSRLANSVALVAIAVSFAAEAADQVADTDGQLESVIVTANKRSENIKDVPISISVIGGNELEDHHVVDYDTLTRSVPGVSFGAGASGGGAGEGLANIEIRGVSSTTGSATVAVYLDDTPITVRNVFDGASQPTLFDMDRVEVLRGPQGTLYGASSMGGTIRFITKQPDLNDFSTEVGSDLSGTEHGGVNYDEQGVVNVPIVPGIFGLRAGIDYGDDSGWIDHYSLATGALEKTGVNDQRHLVLKLIGKLQEDDLTVTPELYFQRYYSSDSPVFYPAEGLYEQDKQVAEPSRDTMFLPSLNITKGLGFADLTSVTSYFWRQMSRISDGTYYNSTVFTTYFLDSLPFAKPAQDDAILATLPSPVYFSTTYGQATEELRLTSRPKEETGLPIKWVFGLFYDDQWDTHRDNEPIDGLNAAFKSIYGYSIGQTDSSLLGTDVNPNEYANDVIYFSSSRYDERQYAVFGQTDFDVLPDLHGSVGLRYLYSRVSYTRYGGGFYDLGNISPYVQVSRYYAATPKFSLTYDVSDASSIYTTVAKGFRLGGPTGPTPVGPNNACTPDYDTLGITNPPTKYDSDKLWSYELGTKSSFLGNTLSANGAIYYIDWQGIQQTINLPTCGFSFTENVGNAESYGAELEMRYKPPVVKGLTLGLAGGPTHAVITSTTNSATAAVGQKLLNTPDWTATFSADYSWDLNDKLSAFVRADYTWTGRGHGSYVQSNSDYTNPQYDVLNASIGVDAGTFQVSLYAKNLSDDKTIIQQPQVNTVITGYTVPPLTVGVHVAAQF